MAGEDYMSLSGAPRSIWKDFRFIIVFVLCLALIASTVVFAVLFFKDNGKAKNADEASQFQWLTDDVTSKMNSKIDPCDDFYQYSCGGYISSHPLQSGQHVSNPTFDTITVNNYFTLMGLLEQQWPLLSDLYDSCTMDPDTLNQITLATFQDLLGQINVASTAEKDFFKSLSFVHSLGSDAFFTPGQSDNIFQANSLNYLHLVLSGITDIDFTDPADTTELKKSMFQFFQLFNLSDPTQSSQDAFNIEQALFNLVPSDDTSFTMQELYSFMSWNDFLSYANYNYTEYASNLGITINSNSGVVLTLDTYIANLTSVIQAQTPQTLTSYLQWRTFNSIYSNNPTIIVEDDSLVSFIKENKKERETTSTLKSIVDKVNKNKKVVDTDALKKVFLSSPSQQQLMQKLMCVDAVDSLLGDFLGLLFTLNIIDDDVISDIEMVTNGVQSAFKNSLSDLTWLDQESKVNASYKLSQIIQIIGHPNKLQRYRGLSLDDDAYLSNIMLINQQVFLDDMTAVGTVFNRSDFEFSSTIVNAFYSPNTNTINFPAGILESPMFSTSFPTILQFARMGYVIGHETTHGFDNNGRLWNANGQYQDIMTEESSDNFVTQAQCIVNQYNNYVAVPSSKLHVNGQKTLGENIADLGGAKNAFRAYQNWLASNGKEKGTDKSPIVKDLTNNQLFFVMLGQTWCTVADDAYLTAQVQQDPHSPAPFRVNGPLSNFDEFSTAFKCKKNSAMNPDTKCNLW